MIGRFEFPFDSARQARIAGRMRRRLFGVATTPLAFIVVILAAGGGSALLIPLAEQLPPGWRDFGALGAGLLLVVALVLGLRFFNRAMCERAIRPRRYDGGAAAVEATADGVVWSWPDGSVSVLWRGVDLIDDGPEFVLFIAGGLGFAVPRSAFGSDAARLAFVRACAEKLSPEALKRSKLKG